MKGIYRCADGHLFRRSVRQMLLEANLGPGRHVAKCPVDGKVVRYERVDPGDLSEQELASVR